MTLRCVCQGDGSEGAEEDIESALEALLDAQMAEGSEGDEDGDEEEDFSDDDVSDEGSEDDGSGGGGIKRILSVPAAADCQLSNHPPTKRRAVCTSPLTREADTATDGRTEVGSDCGAVSDDDDEHDDMALAKDDPPNFSQVDTSLSDDLLEEHFPHFIAARQRSEMIVTLQAGEMLFLPAGWFHEVKSVGPPPAGHLALNYWFHPPDGVSFDKPYEADFWPKEWAARGEKV